MCGICGVVDFQFTPPAETVLKMTDALFHRGPDTGGIEAFQECILGHRRLSILDLSDNARQPMLSKDGLTAIVFNGEIYNFKDLRSDLEKKGHVFVSTSDTEVLLKMYIDKKESMFSELNGMFSVAIWDERRRRLILARDRVGKKPLYYCVAGKRISFSSELFSLMKDAEIPRTVSNQAVFEFFLYDFVPSPHSIFEAVNKLPPAHIAVFDETGMTITRYWSPPRPGELNNYQAARQELDDLLKDSVKRRLISDVPLGAFLSGGIDSTLISSLMVQESSERLKTFSISFPGTTYDESAWSRLAANFIGSEHREYPVEYNIIELLPKLARHFGEPFGDSSAIPTWHLCRHTRDHVTVALSGDGGDELFAGYERYVARRLQIIYDMAPLSIRTGIIEPIVNSLPATTDYYGTSFTKKMKLFVRSCERMRDNRQAVVPRTFSVDEAARLIGVNYAPEKDPVLSSALEWNSLDPVSRMMFADIQTYLSDDILTKVDRMSMAHALEVRSPLLDYRIVELACSMPLQFKLRRCKTKRILKDVAKDKVPQGILDRSKYGFQVPLGRWFKDDLKSWAQDRVLDRSDDFFDKQYLEKIWTDHQDGRADNAHKLWLIIFFMEWRTLFNV